MLRLTVRLAVAALAATALSLGVAATPAYAVVPNTTITSGPDGAYLLPGPVTFTFTADQPGSTFECRIDNDPTFTACTSPATYDLPFGTHFFRVRAVNGGLPDATPEVRYWVIRNVPCEQAGEAYAVAQGRYFEQQQKLVKAKRQLHRTHSHGSAAEFQHAKNKIRKIKAKIRKFKDAMNAATAQENAVC